MRSMLMDIKKINLTSNTLRYGMIPNTINTPKQIIRIDCKMSRLTSDPSNGTTQYWAITRDITILISALEVSSGGS